MLTFMAIRYNREPRIQKVVKVNKFYKTEKPPKMVKSYKILAKLVNNHVKKHEKLQKQRRFQWWKIIS